jgi:hypothetical protein
MYRKRKMTLTPRVGVEELKRKLRREVLGDLRPLLEAQGIQFPDIGGAMSDEQRRSSFASATACSLILLVRVRFPMDPISCSLIS